MEVVEEEFEEEIVYRPSLQGSLAEGDKKITLESYQQVYRMGLDFILCALIYERLRAALILNPSQKSLPELDRRTSTRPMRFIKTEKGTQ